MYFQGMIDQQLKEIIYLIKYHNSEKNWNSCSKFSKRIAAN